MLNTFIILLVACEFVNSGVAAIFGPQDKSTANYVQSMCDSLDIPHIAARWDSEPKRGNVINLYPHPEVFSTVLIFLLLFLVINYKHIIHKQTSTY